MDGHLSLPRGSALGSVVVWTVLVLGWTGLGDFPGVGKKSPEDKTARRSSVKSVTPLALLLKAKSFRI
jgi:hypothetical protein